MFTWEGKRLFSIRYLCGMEESLEIPVTYKGQELSFPCKIMPSGFVLAFGVEVAGQLVTFEPDEERNYRAVLPAPQMAEGFKIEPGLLKAIAEVIESIVK
jgi:hypothetical protein